MKNNKSGGVFLVIIAIIVFNMFRGLSVNGTYIFSNVIFVVILLIGLGFIFRKTMTNQANKSNNNSDIEKNIFEKIEEERLRRKNNNTISKKESQSKSHDYSHRCPNCKTLISSKDRVCPECGTIQNSKVRCLKCGHDNPAGNVLCENCNEFLY